MAENTKVVFARVPAELQRTLKFTAAPEGVPLTEPVERAVRTYLASA